MRPELTIEDAKAALKGNAGRILEALLHASQKHGIPEEVEVVVRHKRGKPLSSEVTPRLDEVDEMVFEDVIVMSNVAVDPKVESITEGVLESLGLSSYLLAITFMDVHHPGWRLEHELVAKFRFSVPEQRILVSLSFYREENVEEVIEP
jgi:hypothetical protein